jgi:hypothetical protein
MSGGHLKGLRLMLWSVLRNPVAAVEGRVAAAEMRVAAAETRMRQNLMHRLRMLLLKVALGATAGILVLIGGVYLLIGIWLGFSHFLGPIGASFILGVLFFVASCAPLAMLYTVIQKSKTAPPQ